MLRSKLGLMLSVGALSLMGFAQSAFGVVTTVTVDGTDAIF